MIYDFVEKEKEGKKVTVYDFYADKVDGEEICLDMYKDKVLLIVNTATECGFTRQLADLQELYDKYKDQGLVVLGFPCNQFGGQAPGTGQELQEFCFARFGASFPQFAKVDVIGPDALPLFIWLEASTIFTGFGKGEVAKKMDEIAYEMDPEYMNNSKIKWNFTKFLINRRGEVIGRYEPTIPMNVVEQEINDAL